MENKDDRVLSEDQLEYIELKAVEFIQTRGSGELNESGLLLLDSFNHIQFQSEQIADLKAKLDALQERNDNLQAAREVAEKKLTTDDCRYCGEGMEVQVDRVNVYDSFFYYECLYCNSRSPLSRTPESAVKKLSKCESSEG